MVGPTGITVVYGAIAQLVEHLHGMQGVSGSNPLGSTRESQVNPGFFCARRLFAHLCHSKQLQISAFLHYLLHMG